MGKKEASKGREWEKGRRDVLNQTFSELHKALPNYVEGRTVSKKTILIQALSCIHQLRQEQKGELTQGNELMKLSDLQKWVHHILIKFCQLLTFLNSINVNVPSDSVSLGTPPDCVTTDILNLLTKIKTSFTEDHCEDQVAFLKRKLKAGKKKKGDSISKGISSTSNLVQSACSQKVTSISAGKLSPTNFKSDSKTTLMTSSSVIQSNPLLVQSSSLQVPSQLLFTSNTPSSPLSTPLPLLVSVTGVKTVNPFILVQSNVVTPSPLSKQKVGCNIDRPIQPGPPNKASRKLKKVPIPFLRQKSVLSNTFSSGSTQKLLKRDCNGRAPKGTTLNNEQVCKEKKILKTKTVTTPLSAELNLGMKISESPNVIVSENQADSQSPDSQNVKVTNDVDKENVAERNNFSKHNVDGNQSNSFSFSTSKEIIVNDNDVSCKSDVVKEVDSDLNLVQMCAMEKQQRNEEDVSRRTEITGVDNSATKRLCEVDINTDCVKRSKCDPKGCNEDKSKSNSAISNDLGSNSEETSPVKMSKSNYSISALCERQQLMQSSEMTSQVPETDNLLEVISEENRTTIGTSKRTASANEETGSGISSTVKLNDVSCTLGKGKVLSSSIDSYTDWSNKSKCKMDRVCSSYSVFAGLPVHNSKNTFIPISDMDGFKSVPESFDAADTSFGLPLPSSDISNDIFASLQVPTGGQHSESISPTAAFLLAFPLVSTSKATELLSEEGVCENSDSQPGMKTILQIGNLDCDTPVTKCVNVFPSIESSSVIYTTSNVFSQDTLSVSHSKSKSNDTIANNGNYTDKGHGGTNSPKINDSGRILPEKETSNFTQKDSEQSKGSQPCVAKADYQTSCINSSKEDVQTRQENHSNGQSDTATLQNKTGTELSTNILNKSTQKTTSAPESTPFLLCDKQTDWMEMTHTPQVAYADFPVSSASRSDCAVNYALPPALMSSSTISEELVSVSRNQASLSSSGILSWSTLSSVDITQPTKVPHRPPTFQDMCSISKQTGKAHGLPQLVASQNVNTSVSGQSHLASGSVLGDKLNTVIHHFDQTDPLINSNHELLMSEKQNSSSVNFLSRSNADAKKSFAVSVENKLIQCGSSQAVKVSSNVQGGVLFSHQQQPTQGTPSSSTSVMYSVADPKQTKINNVFFDERVLAENVKTGMNSNVSNLSAKQAVNQLNYRQSNSIVPVANQTSISSDYINVPNLNVKEGIEHNSMMMNVYQHQNSNMPKHQGIPSNQFPIASAGFHDTKKSSSHYESDNHGALMEVPKQNVSGLNFNSENPSNMMQFGATSVVPLAVHEEQYNNDKANGLERQEAKVQTSQQRQQCVRANNKVPATNLHRPPVNWMTAPDIRSHQHHSGPSFGNNSNMNNTQGLLYLPEHPKDPENNATVFDQTANFHCLDLPHSGQPLYKGNDLHLFGNENVDNFHDNSAWSPNKNGTSSMLGNIMIPSTLPTLVGDLALGDNNICRPFLPSYNNDTPLCSKKNGKRSVNAPRRSEKTEEESSVTSGAGQECAGSFLSVSQLVNTGSGSKSRSISSKENNLSYIASFSDHDNVTCQSMKQNTSKLASSNYSTEALLSSSNGQQINLVNHRKRRPHGAHYSNSHGGSGMHYQNSSTLQVQGPQAQFLPDLSRTNDFQGAFLHSDASAVPSFMLSNPPRTHRNHSYSVQNISERPSAEDTSSTQRGHQILPDITSSRPRTTNNITLNNSATSSSASVSSNNIIDFAYMNVPSTVLQDDMNFSNPPPPHPSFLSHHHSYPMSTQDAHYTTPRLPIHPTHTSQNGSIQSPSATTLTNFHLSTIFPEINEKVIC